MNGPEVTIEQGTLRGSCGSDIKGDNFYKFQGIPYAKPPLGELRFKAPVPPEPWIGTFDATKEGDMCYSRDPLKNWDPSGTENCLVLNVYTKKLPDGENSDLRPVMFWIHGGGFFWGHSGEEYYAPHFLISEDVVVVTTNYRLGMFGFLSLEDPSLDIPGNAGFKDQVMALKWVQRNISKFGGDPQNVTIFGESAGGAAVHLHVLSPMSKGLFHKVIAQSGCALNCWATAKPNASNLATIMNVPNCDRTIYQSLMEKSTHEIIEIQDKIIEQLLPAEPRLLNAAVIEKESKEPFLVDDPARIIKSGNFNQVPLMVGFTTCEGMLFDLFPQPDVFSCENMIPYAFGYRVGTPESRLVAEKIKNFYFGDEGVSEGPISKKYELLSDVHFLYGIYDTVMSHLAASKAPIYLYRMSIESELNFFKKFLQNELPGVCHLDDVGYLFKHFATPEVKPGTIEDIGRARFVRLWTNFAKFGNPTPDPSDPVLKTTWLPVTGPNLDFLDIGKDLVAMADPYSERINFWRRIWAQSPAAKRNEN